MIFPYTPHLFTLLIRAACVVHVEAANTFTALGTPGQPFYTHGLILTGGLVFVAGSGVLIVITSSQLSALIAQTSAQIITPLVDQLELSVSTLCATLTTLPAMWVQNINPIQNLNIGNRFNTAFVNFRRLFVRARQPAPEAPFPNVPVTPNVAAPGTPRPDSSDHGFEFLDHLDPTAAVNAIGQVGEALNL